MILWPFYGPWARQFPHCPKLGLVLSCGEKFNWISWAWPCDMNFTYTMWNWTNWSKLFCMFPFNILKYLWPHREKIVDKAVSSLPLLSPSPSPSHPHFQHTHAHTDTWACANTLTELQVFFLLGAIEKSNHKICLLCTLQKCSCEVYYFKLWIYSPSHSCLGVRV